MHMFMRVSLWTFLGFLVVFVAGGLVSPVWASTCTFDCQWRRVGAETGPTLPSSESSPSGIETPDACEARCNRDCAALLTPTFMVDGVHPGAITCFTHNFVFAASSEAVADGPCVPPIAEHTDYTCAAVRAGSSAFSDRHCVREHCGSLRGTFCCAPVGATALGGGSPDCGHAAVAARTAGGAGAAGIDARIQEGWVCAIPSAAQQTQCATYTGCTPLNASAKCCPAGVGNTALGRPGATGAGSSAGGGGGGGAGLAGALHLPDCATSHDPNIAGKCTLDDIKQVGVNFANFLMGLAAAFFLLIFVYAGFKYIFFAYDSGTAGEARKMLTSSAIGMLLVLGAATIVRFVQTTATGRAPVEDRCASTKGSTYSCQDASHLSDAIKRNCTPTTDHLCPGNASNRCCPVPAGTGLTPAGGATTPGAAGACNATTFVSACNAACDSSGCASAASTFAPSLITQCHAACNSNGPNVCAAAHTRTECGTGCETLWNAQVPAAARALCSNPCDGLCAAAFP